MKAPTAAEREQLRARVLRSLGAQGFRIRAGRLVPPDSSDKERLRALHAEAVRHQINRAREGREGY